MTREQAEREMVDGYLDGFDLDAPYPSDNRSHSYRHGFANARADRSGNVRGSAQEMRELARSCIVEDMGGYVG